jgi:glycosyltransferase involved in cell wall biosynthesis
MNILVLSYEYPPIGGGAGRVMEALANHWTAAGHQVTILSGGLGQEPETQQQGLVQVIRVPSGRNLPYRSNPWQMMRWARNAWRYLLEHQLERSVVVANFMLPGGWVAHRLYRRWAWPYLIVTHGHDVPGAAPEEMRWYHTALRPLMRQIGKAAQGVVALNAPLHHLLVSFLPDQASRIYLLPNGLNAAHVRARLPGEGPLRMAWAGRLVQQKRPDLALQVAEDLPFPFKLDLYGDGPMRVALERKLRANPNQHRIRLHGFVPREQWLDALEHSDLLLHTARFEAMSLVQLEACSRGVYVLSGPVGGTEPWLEQGMNGEMLPNWELPVWREALTRFYHDCFLPGYEFPPSYAAQLEGKLSWAVLAEQYLDILGEMQSRAFPR